jgi:two-component system sensor kinase FixL
MLNQAERLSAIINTTVDGIIVIDDRGLIESFNPAAERLFGYAESEVAGRNVSMLMPSPFHEEHDGYLDRYQRTGQAAIIGTGREVRGRRKDGSVFPLHLSVGEMTVDGERKFTGVLHDLTDRVKIEDQLRESEERWRAVIDSAIDGIIVIDGRGRIEAFNPAAMRLFGYTEQDVIGQNVNMLMPSPYHEQHDGYLSHYLTTGDAKIIGKGRDVTGRRKDGTTFPLHLSVGETITKGERRFTGILHDLTERVALEARLREQSALAKLGEMAAVIAHEVKNPLAGIRGAVQVIGGRLPAASTDAMMMKEIVSRIDSLDAMMKDLLVFARPPKPRLASIEIVPLLQMTADLLKKDQSVEHVEISIAGSAPPVTGDPDMLKMVIQNLLINGAHAMQGRGRIRVGVDTIDGWCRVSIADDGPGIPAEIREKIFMPFFTTKNRGTGLGLATAKRFIEAHDGLMTVTCPPSGGTTVTVQLPGSSGSARGHE